jgi:hypothetical protein
MKFVDLGTGSNYRIYQVNEIVSLHSQVIPSRDETGEPDKSVTRFKLNTTDGRTHYLDEEEGRWLADVLSARAYRRGGAN